MHLKHTKKPRIINLDLDCNPLKTGLDISFYPKDDGDLRMGHPQSDSRFVDNGDGTISDILTGLVWVKDPSEIGGVWGTPGMPSMMTWFEAIDNCEALSYAGYNDWRLPNVLEIESIIDFGRIMPAIDDFFFPNTQWDGYWTSSVMLAWTDSAWMIWFYEGYRSVDMRDWMWFVRPVRKGQS